MGHCGESTRKSPVLTLGKLKHVSRKEFWESAWARGTCWICPLGGRIQEILNMNHLPTEWRVLTKCDPLEKGMANHFSILALRTPWTAWKGKKIGHQKMNSPDWYVANMLLEKSGEIIPERMKRQSQSKNNIQVLMWLVMEVKFDAVKNNIVQEPGTLGPWVKVNWKWSNSKCQERTLTF